MSGSVTMQASMSTVESGINLSGTDRAEAASTDSKTDSWHSMLASLGVTTTSTDQRSRLSTTQSSASTTTSSTVAAAHRYVSQRQTSSARSDVAQADQSSNSVSGTGGGAVSDGVTKSTTASAAETTTNAQGQDSNAGAVKGTAAARHASKPSKSSSQTAQSTEDRSSATDESEETAASDATSADQSQSSSDDAQTAATDTSAMALAMAPVAIPTPETPSLPSVTVSSSVALTSVADSGPQAGVALSQAQSLAAPLSQGSAAQAASAAESTDSLNSGTVAAKDETIAAQVANSSQAAGGQSDLSASQSASSLSQTAGTETKPKDSATPEVKPSGRLQSRLSTRENSVSQHTGSVQGSAASAAEGETSSAELSGEVQQPESSGRSRLVSSHLTQNASDEQSAELQGKGAVNRAEETASGLSASAAAKDEAGATKQKNSIASSSEAVVLQTGVQSLVGVNDQNGAFSVSGVTRDVLSAHAGQSAAMASSSYGDNASSSTNYGALGAQNTFAALDSGTAQGATVWTHAGSRQAEAGYKDPNLGWISVKAEYQGGEVHASILPSSTSAAEVLGQHIGGLNAYLNETHSAVSSLTLDAPSGFSGAESGSHSDNRQNSSQQTETYQAGDQSKNSGQVESSSVEQTTASLSTAGRGRLISLVA